MLIDQIWAETIARNAGFISVSINAATEKTHEKINRGSSWKRVLANIQNIRNVCRQQQRHVAIIGRMTIVKENLNEISQFINEYRDLGFDEIDFGYDTRVVPYLACHPIKKKIIREKIKEAVLNSDIVDFCRLQRLQPLGLWEPEKMITL
jgi:wyosine [tRNA(Phe)-imidazoG37] synthetase (radical SAM superfamily)